MSENRGQVQEIVDRRARVELLDANGQPVQIVDVAPAGLSIGRLPGSGLVLDASTVSRNHLRVDWDGQEARVTDLGSRAGTQLGAIRLTPQVAQAWNPNTLLQIGPYTLRLRIEAASAATNVDDAFFENRVPLPMASPATALLDAGPTGHYDPRSDSGRTGRLSDQPAQVEASLVPGSDVVTIVPGIPARADVHLANRGNIPEIVRLHVEGVPPEWVYQPEPILLAPGSEATSTVQVNIPADASSRAGAYPVIIRVHAVERGEDLTSLVSNWVITSFTDTNLQVTPKRIADRKQAIYTLELTNLGNHASRYALDASDSAMVLSYLFGQTHVVVEPGETVEVPLTVEAPNRLIGSQQGYSINVQAISSEGDQQIDTVAFAHQALIPLWMIPIALLLLLGLGLLGASLLNPQRGTAVAGPVTDLRTIVAQTATVAAAQRSEQETQIASVLNQTSTAIAALPIGQRAAAQTAQAIAVRQTEGVLNQQRADAEAQAQQTAQVAAQQAQQTQQVALQQTDTAAQATAVAGNQPTPTLLPTLTRLPATVVAGAPTNTVLPTGVLLPTSTAAIATSTPTSTPTNTAVTLTPGGPTLTATPVTPTNTPVPGSVVISFGAPPSPTFLGGNFTVTATTNSNGALTFAFESGPCTLVSAADGTFSPTGVGTCVVRANTAATSTFSAGTNTLNVVIGKAITVINWANPAAITFGTPLGPTQLNATASVGGTPVPGTFTYNPPTGTVLDAGPRSLSVSFVPADTAAFTTPADRSVTINVGKATPVINWANPAAITFGTALSGTQLNATATAGGNPVPGTFTYNPPLGTVLNAGNGQDLSVSFTPTNTANFNTPAAKIVKINVGQATPSITFNTPLPTPNFLSGNFTVAATTNSDGGLTYSSTTPAVCVVVNNTTGSFSPVTAGTCTVRASTASTTNFSAGTQTQNVTIDPGTPTITFDLPLPTPVDGGPNFTVPTTTNPPGLPVTYRVISGPCARVGNSSSNTFRSTGAGTCTVEATIAAAPPNLLGTSAQQPITITAAPPAPLVVNAPAPAIIRDINSLTSFDITGSGFPTNPAVLTVTFTGFGNGTVTNCSATKCTVTPPTPPAGTPAQEVDLVVSSPISGPPVTLPKAFVYRQVATSVTISAAAPFILTINGEGFGTTANTTVQIGGSAAVPATSVNANGTQLTVDFGATRPTTGQAILTRVNNIGDANGQSVP